MECGVREGDFSQKKVYRCEMCDRWFCERHIEPRLAFIKDLKVIEKFPEVRALYCAELKREDGHPDFAYSSMKLIELDIEEKGRKELAKQALDVMNRYYADTPLSKKPVDVDTNRKRRSDFPKHLESALIATFIIALLFGMGIAIPMLAITTQSPIIVILGILGFLFLIFLVLEYGMHR